MPRYETLAELLKARIAGFVPQDAALTIDNDSVFMYVGDGPDDDNPEEVFEMHPRQLLEQALDLLFLPHEGA